MKQAVILLAYGGPDSLADIPAYLLDIRGGRPTSQELIDDISDRYRQIGGRSPLLEITNEVAHKVLDPKKTSVISVGPTSAGTRLSM